MGRQMHTLPNQFRRPCHEVMVCWTMCFLKLFSYKLKRRKIIFNIWILILNRPDIHPTFKNEFWFDKENKLKMNMIWINFFTVCRCQECNKGFMRHERYMTHLRWHSGKSIWRLIQLSTYLIIIGRQILNYTP